MLTIVNSLVFDKSGRAYPAKVEVEVTNGIGIHVVGIRDNSVKELLLRIVTAMRRMGYHVPGKKIVINFASPLPAREMRWVELLDYPAMLALITAVSDEGPGIINDVNYKSYYLGKASLDGLIFPLESEQYYSVLKWKCEFGGDEGKSALIICPNSFPTMLNVHEH